MVEEPLVLSFRDLETPLGPMRAIASPGGLCALEFQTKTRHDRLDARLARWFPAHELVDRDTPVIARTRRWLKDYFAGRSADVDGLAFDMRGAPFERRVWQALLAIPAGTTASYGAIAKQLGSPDASRAVGAANGANPVAIIVPCHRVVGSSGSLVGYGGGLEKKRWLLDHERAHFFALA